MRGSLVDLRDPGVPSHLFYTDSPLIEDFIVTTALRTAGSSFSELIEVNSKRRLDESLSLLTIYPLKSDKWVFKFDVPRLMSYLPQLYPFFDTATSISLFLTPHYKYFKSIANRKVSPASLHERYIGGYLSLPEIEMMLNGVPVYKDASKFIYNNYRSDPEAALKLRQIASQGTAITKGSDITNALGVSTGTTDQLVMRMLKLGLTGKSRSYTTSTRQIVRSVNLFLDKIPPPTFQKRLLTASRDFLAIKTMYISGDLIDAADIPSTTVDGGMYSGRRLKKYRFMFDTITHEIPLERIQRYVLDLNSESPWRYSEDVLQFIYSWFDYTEIP